MLVGPFRRPRNLEQADPRSINNDEQARKLGFRGGTIAGSFHMEQFPPTMLRAFGERWFERGGLSCYFRNATMDNEAVRTLAQIPADGASDAQINVWMERDDGMQVLEGTASIGAPSEPSMLRRKMAEPREAGELRILAQHTAGDEIRPTTARLRTVDVAARLEVCTEPLDWYTGASPWGGPIANPSGIVHLMYHHMPIAAVGRIVGLFGAIEINHLDGPLFVDRDYDIRGNILALGTSPKSEYVWYETIASEPAAGRDVASMIMMLRFMKASSPLWES
jgi:hypothetical protein